MNNGGKCATERARQGKTTGSRTYLAIRTQFWLVLIQVRLPHESQWSQGFKLAQSLLKSPFPKEVQASFDLILLGVGLLGQRGKEAGRNMAHVTLGLSLLGRTNPAKASLRMS